MSDAETIMRLVLNRSKVDGSYGALREIQHLMEATEMATMYEPIFLTYVDLDRLIDECGLTEMQRCIVDALMTGYTILDYAEMHNCRKQNVYTQLIRAAEKIAQANTKNWERTYCVCKQ